MCPLAAGTPSLSSCPWRARADLFVCMLSQFSCVRLSVTPWSVALQAPLSMRFSRQEYWSGLPFPSPMHESEKWKWSRTVVPNSQRPYGLKPTRLLHSWDFPGKSTGVGCHCLLHNGILLSHKKNKIMLSAATWVQLEIITASELSLKEKENTTSLTCGI